MLQWLCKHSTCIKPIKDVEDGDIDDADPVVDIIEEHCNIWREISNELNEEELESIQIGGIS